MYRSLLAIVGLLILVAPSAVRGQGNPSAFLRRPSIHGDQIAFTCEGDLWLGDLKSGSARRITTHEGVESAACFSPDGASLAFLAQYDGNVDVYVMPIEGGQPRRLTWDPAGPRPVSWTADGKYVLFRSRRNNPAGGNRIYRVPAAGGMPELLPVPRAEFASLHADGKRLAYVPVSGEWQYWKRYQGGQADDVWLTDIERKTFRKVTDYAGVDTSPIWVGNQLYIVSEREGLANLFKLDWANGRATAVTRYSDYDVSYPATDGKRIVFQHGAGIALFDPASGQARDLSFSLNSDRIHARPKRVAVQNSMVRASLGPTGKRLLVEARGHIVSVPVENGDSREIAPLQGARSQYPSWSPDGKSVAFVSDRSGEEQIWIASSGGSLLNSGAAQSEPRQVTRDRKGPLGRLLWSPDGKKIATSDRETRVLIVDVETGETVVVDQGDRSYTYDFTVDSYRFSPDSKWLAYTRLDSGWNSVVCLYNLETKVKTAVTSSLMDSSSPAFDPSGKYLAFLSDRSYDRLVQGVNRYYTFDRTTRVSLLPLTAETPSPFLLKSDEEGQPDAPATGGAPMGPGSAASKPETKIDLDGIADRILDVPVPTDRYTRVDFLQDGRLLLASRGEGDTPSQLRVFDPRRRQLTTLGTGVAGFELSADRKKLLIRSGRDLSVVDAGSPVAPGAGRVNLAGLTVHVEPAAEWRQMFHETWRIARDFFYDPNMHGVDWEAVRRKYVGQLAAVGDRSDLTRLFGEMLGELSVGHAYVGAGDQPSVSGVAMGYLGADLEPASEGNAYRVVRVFRGDQFELGSRSPLLEPGVNVKEGHYILAVAGQPVRTDQDIQALLVGTPGQVITLTVNTKPSLEGAREVRIRPMASESQARYYDWVESRREYVRKNGGPNLGYLHIPDMSSRGIQEFAKHYYPNLEKDAIVYDVRNNGGGWISATLLVHMAARPLTYFKPRYGLSWTRQDFGFPGHSVALCNEASGSNAEEFCDGFQRLKLGPVIGVRTWGGEVGSGGGYSLVDGGAIFIPNYAAWEPQGKWIIEGTGVQPDIVVEQDPAAVMAGRDPQLDRAIQHLKEKLLKEPISRPTPPPFPNKALRSPGETR